MINTIQHGKWEDVMPNISDKSIDLVVTSPPYNVKLGTGKNPTNRKPYDTYDDDMTHDEYLTWMERLFVECNRVLKTGGRMCINIGSAENGKIPTHAFFTQRALELDLPEPFIMMTTIIWDKAQTSNRSAWGSWLSPSSPSFPTPFEYILIFAKGTLVHSGDKNKITINKDQFVRNSLAIWRFAGETQLMKKYDHSAMFPEELPQRLIEMLSYEDDVVLDPFSGAGTTCVVAKRNRRQYIGIEMSEKYVNESRKRLGQENPMFSYSY